MVTILAGYQLDPDPLGGLPRMAGYPVDRCPAGCLPQLRIVARANLHKYSRGVRTTSRRTSAVGQFGGP